MAEEEASEDISIDEAGKDKILGLPKKIFFIAVAGLVVILLAVGGYFFFAAGDNADAQNQANQAANNLQNQTNAPQAQAQAQAGGSLFFPSDSAANNGQPMPNPNQGQPAPQQGQAVPQGQNMPHMPANPNEMMGQIFQLREQVIYLKEENLILKKRIYDLETGNGANNNAKQTSSASDNQRRQNPYDAEIKDFPPIEPYVPVEKPKPKWG